MYFIIIMYKQTKGLCTSEKATGALTTRERSHVISSSYFYCDYS